MARAKRVITKALVPFARPWLSMTRDRSRVLGYHDVPESESFRRQVEYLVDRFRVIGSARLDERLDSGRPSVWITFDDGDPSVVNGALPILSEYGLHATLFVCPGVIDTDEPYWWHVVEAAADQELSVRGRPVTPALVSRLKQVSNQERLETVAEIRGQLEAVAGKPLQARQLTAEQLQAWIGAGNTVGNHTWDHPLLDRCDPNTQREQILQAHQWLQERVGPEQILFAYPNGNWTQVAEEELRALGYQYAFLFDHRLAKLDNPFRVSRIRVNADDDLDTFVARASGLHPAIHHVLGRA